MKKIFLLPLVCLCLAGFAEAQVESTGKTKEIEAAVRKIPLEGNKPEDFVPADWEIFSQAVGDLNGDGLNDYALNILPKTEDENYYDAVVVLLAEKGGRRLRRADLNDNLTSSGFDAGEKVEIEKGVLVVNSNYGNNSATDVTYRFRYDPAAKDLMLIGFDFETYTRSGNEDGYATSYNFLTGVREDTTKHIDRRKNARAIYDKSETKRTRIERVKIPFEKAQFNWEEGRKAPLPY